MSRSESRLRAAVVGAGVVGCYLGGRLARYAEVTLVGRPYALEPIAAVGLTVESRDGDRVLVPSERLRLTGSAAEVADADVVLVCTKAGATAEATRAFAPHLRDDAVVIGLQNGLHSADTIRDNLRVTPVTAGVVPFNVARTGPATYRRTSSGEVVLERRPEVMRLAQTARVAGMRVRTSPDIQAVLHGKVLLNLNNAVQALSGLPLRRELLDRDLRRCLAWSQSEGNRVFHAAGVVPQVPLSVPARLLPTTLRVPTPLFRVLAQATLQVDADGTSSMADDLERGRPTEVESLQGEVVAMGRRLGIATPVAERVCELVHEAEHEGPDRRRWTGRELLAELRAARRGLDPG